MRLLIGVFSAIFVTPALFFVPLPQGRAIWFLLGTAFVHAVYELLLVKSYESAAFSAVYPVARGTGPAVHRARRDLPAARTSAADRTRSAS